MDFTPEALLDIGGKMLDHDTVSENARRAYYDGKHDLPYAPHGVNEEYEALRHMARVPLIRLAIRTPVQRCRIDGIRTGTTEETDKRTWDVWQFNRLDARQRVVYTDALTYERGGIVSVWPNPESKSKPFIKVEDPMKVYVHADPEDPYESLWAVKVWSEQVIEPDGTTFERKAEVLYTKDRVYRFESNRFTTRTLVDEIVNPLGQVPFVRFVPEVDSNGEGHSLVDPLVPMQKAIDTMRFNLLLAAQFAAFRQRVITGFDPVLRDADGNVVVKMDRDGVTPLLDSNGQQIPVVASPGKAGVDRLLVFPGTDTEVFDLAESNLNNYVAALDMLIATFASTSQVPPQYLVGDFKNVSGDLMVATEATLLSFVADLQTAFGESWERVFQLVNIAAGEDELPLATEVVWADASPKSLATVATAMAQMVPHGAPARMFLELLPGATQQKVDRWMGMSQDALQRALSGDLAAALSGAKEARDGNDAADPLGTG